MFACVQRRGVADQVPPSADLSLFFRQQRARNKVVRPPSGNFEPQRALQTTGGTVKVIVGVTLGPLPGPAPYGGRPHIGKPAER